MLISTGAVRFIGVSILLALGVVASGCGSSDQGRQAAVSQGFTPESNPEVFYRYEGTGKNKKKVFLSHRERAKARFEARKKLEAGK